MTTDSARSGSACARAPAAPVRRAGPRCCSARCLTAERDAIDSGGRGSPPADLELAEADAELDPRPVAGQGQGDLSLGEGLGLGRLDGARGGGRAGIGAEQLPDVADPGELPVA